MNHQLIEKAVKTHYKTCPRMVYDNPLIDREVASALAKSFVKILNLTAQRNINISLRTTVLSSIRKICQLQPENHLKMNENITNLLVDLFLKVNQELLITSTDKNLSEFLMRSLKDHTLNSKYEYPINPEILRSLLNLNESNVLKGLSKNLIHLGSSDKHQMILQCLWDNKSNSCINFDDLSIKIKPRIEQELLEMCLKILSDDLNINDTFESDLLSDLIEKCAKSSKCFQICCNILNYLLLETNFDSRIQKFIPLFISNVKIHCSETISVLYPSHLGYVVLLMDIDVRLLPESVNNNYIEKVKHLLSDIKLLSQNDLIMLLSHYPDWFDIYFSLEDWFSDPEQHCQPIGHSTY